MIKIIDANPNAKISEPLISDFASQSRQDDIVACP